MTEKAAAQPESLFLNSCWDATNHLPGIVENFYVNTISLSLSIFPPNPIGRSGKQKTLPNRQFVIREKPISSDAPAILLGNNGQLNGYDTLR